MKWAGIYHAQAWKRAPLNEKEALLFGWEVGKPIIFNYFPVIVIIELARISIHFVHLFLLDCEAKKRQDVARAEDKRMTNAGQLADKLRTGSGKATQAIKSVNYSRKKLNKTMSTEENQLYEKELKQLVKLVFDKAKKDSMETTKTGLSKHIETELNSQINHRTLIRYYNQFILGENEEMNHNRSGFDIISGYLGYRNFAEFCREIFPETDIQETKEDFKQESAQGWLKFVPKLNFTQKATGIGILAAAGLGSYFGGDLMNQPECMYWTGVNYEMIGCDEVVHPNTLVIPVNPQLLQHMHKLEVSDTTTFFEADKPIVWYLKTDGKIEFYSAPGNHPVNGKPLKPITDYMINKYVKKAEN